MGPGLQDAQVRKIAVVLPVYNGAAYLEASIASVLAQSLADFEFVVCDDASSDASAQIVQRFEDSRIRFIRHDTNRGLFVTLNELVRLTRAPLVHLWAQDDVMLPECLARHVEFHAAHPEIAMSYSAVRTIDETGRVVFPPKHDTTPAIISPLLATDIMFHHGSITGNIANVTLTRRALDAVGPFREDLTVSADFEMWVRLTRSHAIGRIAEPLVDLRGHSGQFSRKRSSELAFIRQNRTIFDELLERLPPSERDAAARYLVAVHHRSYAHAAVRSLLRGDVPAATAIASELRDRQTLGRALLYWLVTGNGRWLHTLRGRRARRA